jgi:hypothetical protein
MRVVSVSSHGWPTLAALRFSAASCLLSFPLTALSSCTRGNKLDITRIVKSPCAQVPGPFSRWSASSRLTWRCCSQNSTRQTSNRPAARCWSRHWLPPARYPQKCPSEQSDQINTELSGPQHTGMLAHCISQRLLPRLNLLTLFRFLRRDRRRLLVDRLPAAALAAVLPGLLQLFAGKRICASHPSTVE